VPTAAPRMASRPRLLTMTVTAQPAMASRRVMRCGHMIWGSRARRTRSTRPMGFRTPGHAGRHQHADHCDLGPGHDEREPDGRGQDRTEAPGAAGALGQPTAPVEVRADHVAVLAITTGRATSAEVTSPAANRSAAAAPASGRSARAASCAEAAGGDACRACPRRRRALTTTDTSITAATITAATPRA
jgi:hypothetical protein